MKSRILYLAVILLSLQCVTSAQSFWRPIAPIPPTMRVYSTCVIGSKAYFWCEFGQVYSTDDGGNTFTFYPWYTPFDNSALGDYVSNGISFADSLTGYITDNHRGEFRTTDGGRHWVKLSPENTYSGSMMVGFASPKMGFKIGGSGFYKTTDAGLTWTYLQTPLFDDGNLSNMFVQDETNLWILKSHSYGTNSGAAIWRSSDGGTKWSRLNTGITSDSLNEVFYTGFHMNPSGVGYAAGRINRPRQKSINGIILKTTDFGKTWVTREFPGEYYYKLEVINDSSCVVFGNFDGYYGGRVCYRYTGNMGQSWETGNDLKGWGNFNSFYSSAYIPAQKTILVSTVSGTYRSTDAGKSFTRLTSNMDLYASEVSFDNKPQSPETQLSAVVYFYNRDIIVSRDGGRSWILKHLSKDFNLDFSHLSISGNSMYMTVGQNSLYKSTDFGDTWQMISPRRYGAISNVYAVSPDTLVVHAYPNLCISTDGGKNWKYAPLPEIYLNEIKMYSGFKVWGTGDLYRQNSRAGIIYSSSDGGNNWRVQDIAPVELTHVEFIDDLTGFALGGRKIYSTRDGGSSWSVIHSSAVAFTFYDRYRGVILTENSSLVTSDAGLTWKKGNFNFNSLDAKLFFNKRGDLLASSNSTLYMYPDALSQIPLLLRDFASLENTFKVYPNHPNPFNPATTITYEIPSKMHVVLKVYDMLGREVSKLVDKEQPQGEYNVLFDGSSLPSGVYIYTIQAGKYKESRKLMLIK